jgi:hypothetical protein
MKRFSALLILSCLVLQAPGATAMYGGQDATDDLLVTFIQTKIGGQGCSAAVITERIVVTAAHCLNHARPLPPIGVGDYVGYPGTALDKVFLASVGKGVAGYPRQGSKIVDVLTVDNRPFNWDSENENTNDIAILIVETPLPVSPNLRIATKEEIAALTAPRPKSGFSSKAEADIYNAGIVDVTLYGYGAVGDKQYSTTPKKGVFRGLYQTDFKYGVQVKSTNKLYSCSGDSGGPAYIKKDSEILYLGPLARASNTFCLLTPDYTVPWSDIDLLADHMNLFREAEKRVALLPKVERKSSDAKKVTITCVKGKLTKKVTALKPKCPAGYKKK